MTKIVFYASVLLLLAHLHGIAMEKNTNSSQGSKAPINKEVLELKLVGLQLRQQALNKKKKGQDAADTDKLIELVDKYTGKVIQTSDKEINTSKPSMSTGIDLLNLHMEVTKEILNQADQPVPKTDIPEQKPSCSFQKIVLRLFGK